MSWLLYRIRDLNAAGRQFANVLVGLVTGLVVSSAATGQVSMYVFRPTLSGWTLERRDAATGSIESSVSVPRGIPGFFPWGMVHDGARLVTTSIDIGPAPGRFVRIHPADEAFVSTPANVVHSLYCSPSLAIDPLTQTAYYSDRTDLYTTDLQTSQITLIATFSGYVFFGDRIFGLAIDSAGVMYGFGGQGVHGFDVYRIDSSNAALAPLGYVTLTGGFVNSAAFGPNGVLWVSYYNPNTGIGDPSGLYSVDFTTYLPTLVESTPGGQFIRGVAFGPNSNPTNYCSAKLNSLGCAPAIGALGIASPTANTGFVVNGFNIRNQSIGTLAVGVSGRASTPFGGGTLCIAAPWRRTVRANSGGTSTPGFDCSGTWQLDFNSWMSTHTALSAGTVVEAQWLGRDVGFASPGNWTLSNALEFTVLP